MAGTVAHVLNVPFFEAIGLPEFKLQILYNEASRQRALDTISMSQAFGGGKEVQAHLEELLKIHGEYTEGFYEEESAKLKQFLKGS